MVVESVIFYGSLAYNVVLNKLAIRNWYDRIDQHVILGALPFKGKFKAQLIQEENISAVISMNEDHELKAFSPDTHEWKQVGVEFLQLPTRDFIQIPSLDNLVKGVQLIEKHMVIEGSGTAAVPTSVYVHCKAGRTRSATLVACYLVKRHHITAEEAVEIIRSKRPHIYLTDGHLSTIRSFQNMIFQEHSF